jgi:hypothetical protein
MRTLKLNLIRTCGKQASASLHVCDPVLIFRGASTLISPWVFDADQRVLGSWQNAPFEDPFKDCSNAYVNFRTFKFSI